MNSVYFYISMIFCYVPVFCSRASPLIPKIRRIGPSLHRTNTMQPHEMRHSLWCLIFSSMSSDDWNSIYFQSYNLFTLAGRFCRPLSVYQVVKWIVQMRKATELSTRRKMRSHPLRTTLEITSLLKPKYRLVSLRASQTCIY